MDSVGEPGAEKLLNSSGVRLALVFLLLTLPVYAQRGGRGARGAHGEDIIQSVVGGYPAEQIRIGDDAAESIHGKHDIRARRTDDRRVIANADYDMTKILGR